MNAFAGSGSLACTGLNWLCYNSVTEQGQMLWSAAVLGQYGSWCERAVHAVHFPSEFRYIEWKR